MQTNEILALGKQNAHRDKPGGHLVLATSYSRTAYRRTTIGAAAFHCRVRNGNGWGHRAICHQRSEPDWHLNRTGGSAAFAATSADANLWRRYRAFKERQFLWHLHTGVHFG